MVANSVASHDGRVAGAAANTARAPAPIAANVQELVRALGGTQAVAEACGVVPSAVSLWITTQKVPFRHHAMVWRLAQAKGVPWTPPGFEGVRLVRADADHPHEHIVTPQQLDREITVNLGDAA
jgi:transcriptional regulator with XRE-family HTH domain